MFDVKSRVIYTTINVYTILAFSDRRLVNCCSIDQYLGFHDLSKVDENALRFNVLLRWGGGGDIFWDVGPTV